MNKYLDQTELLNYKDPAIQELVRERGWAHMPEREKILAIYNFTRDEILFGYNKGDNMKASDILADGYGQCNTKGILFMALLRAVQVQCRFHGFTIDKELQKGAITGLWYKIAPREIIHSWVEIFYRDQWLNIEGFILDKSYLESLQERFEESSVNFCGYGAATEDLKKPQIEWNEGNTYIQKEGIVQDFGVFDDPDSFLKKYSQDLGTIKRIMFERIIRRSMNGNVNRIRKQNRGILRGA